MDVHNIIIHNIETNSKKSIK